MTLRVLSIPHPISMASQGASGIQTVVAKYAKYLPDEGIEFVEPHAVSFDLMVVHAGMTNQIPNSAPMVSTLHGIYWSADYPFEKWQFKANASVIASIRHATSVTVPSEWVAETLRRDMHLDPYVIGHGVDTEEWQTDGSYEDYVIGYAKNRAGMDVCDPAPLGILAKQFPKTRFVSTFAPPDMTRNVRVTGVLPQPQWKPIVQKAKVYCSFVKETFCIGALEALAAGVPVVGYAEGGIADFVKHGISGYLATPGDPLHLARGLEYCLKHRDTLSYNARLLAQNYSWPTVAAQVANVYRDTLQKYHAPHDVTVVIPCYNKQNTLERAVKSVLASVMSPKEIIIVDNNSTDGSAELAKDLATQYGGDVRITACRESLQGVAHARNRGCMLASTRYICCLDADDEIEPRFLEACVDALKSDVSLGVAYTKLRWVNDKTGETKTSAWPGVYVYDEFFRRKNQVPTCAVFRKDAWQRSGGYRQRYAPDGAGAEDAEFWLRLGALGFGCKLATDQPLFVYHLGGQVSGNPHYSEPDWLAGHPWVYDRKHPFASVATPENLSHPVRQYDDPKVSVIVPVGPGHEQHLFDALDSIEAQTFRKWEAIVVFDGMDKRDEELLKRLSDAFPFIRIETFEQNRGAGAARNAGAKLARAPYLLFLDADDWLAPEAIEILYQIAIEEETISYSDYIGHAYLNDSVELDRLKMGQRLIAHDPKTYLTKIYHNAFDYDCMEAVNQPQPRSNGQFYIWCLITAMTPKIWHDEIGGFDESMPSWEDWDYWLRMARSGKCFSHLNLPLVEYRFFTGTRRSLANPDESGQSGRQLSGKLLQYLQAKKEGSNPMPCGGCKKQRAQVIQPQVMASSMNNGEVQNMSADGMVWVRLNDGNSGYYLISFSGTSYGYRSHGDRFLMSASHARIDHRVVIENLPTAGDLPKPEKPELDAPVKIDDPVALDDTEYVGWDSDTTGPQVFELDGVWGMNPKRKEALMEHGIYTLAQLEVVDSGYLSEILDLAPLTVGRVIASAKRMR